jgi:hypothetical protein
MLGFLLSSLTVGGAGRIRASMRVKGGNDVDRIVALAESSQDRSWLDSRNKIEKKTVVLSGEKYRTDAAAFVV